MVYEKNLEFDVCVVGGGLAGMFTAISASRNGAKVCLIQERPVLGGNASSEVRMWVCGCPDSNYREAGILEEINMENIYYNPYKLFSMWDDILLKKVKNEKNIDLFLNTTCYKASENSGRIREIYCWQMTTQTNINIKAKYFVDCSGDSILAKTTSAKYSIGREGRQISNESIGVELPDCYTMVNSLLIQAIETDERVDFVPFSWAKKLTKEDFEGITIDLSNSYENFWYIELGGMNDTVSDSEKINSELKSLVYGVWDYIKNSGEFESRNWQLAFVGSLPAKRESIRYEGDVKLNCDNVFNSTIFDDAVAYGGWPIDDHHPGGFYHKGRKNNVVPIKPYDIPLRALYSRNISNLFFAGRNISATHIAMSSSRVMATCAMIGQGVGTTIAYLIKNDLKNNRDCNKIIKEIQQQLIEDDSYLLHKTNNVSSLITNAEIKCNGSKNLNNLLNGRERNINVEENRCFIPLQEPLKIQLSSENYIDNIRIVFDSDFRRSTLNIDEWEALHSMRCNVKKDSPKMSMPKTLVRNFTLRFFNNEGLIGEVNFDNNLKRLCKVDIKNKIVKVELVVSSLWNNEISKDILAPIFSFDFK